MDTDLPFGGKIIVFGDDFRQLLPVKNRATRGEMVDLSIKFSSLWGNLKKLSLSQNMPNLPEEANFAKFLTDVGHGVLNDNDNNFIIPDRCLAILDSDIVDDMYENLIREKRYKELASIDILSARNLDVEEINKRVVKLFDKTTKRIYTSVDSIKNFDNGDINEGLLPEHLNTLNPANLPTHELRLRTNCVVILMRSLCINEGLCNGTRLLILELGNHLLRSTIFIATNLVK